MRYVKLFEQFKSHQEIDEICKEYMINNYTINDDGSIDVDGDVILSSNYLKELPLNFRNVIGEFDCSDNELTSLKGSPSKVGGDFDCRSNYLTSLEGAPKEIKGSFHCQINKLTSLDFIPSFIGVDFNLSYNKITSLKGVPNSITGDFNFYSNPIYSLENFPYVGGEIYMTKILSNILSLFEYEETLIDLFNDYNIIKDPKTPGDKPRLKVSNLNKFLSENGFKELEDTSRLEKYYELK